VAAQSTVIGAVYLDSSGALKLGSVTTNSGLINIGSVDKPTSITATANITAASGNLTIATSGTFTQTGGTISTTTSGNISITSEGSSTLQTVTSAGALTLSKYTTSATYSCNGYTITVPGVLTINTGVTLDLGGSDTTVNNTGGSFDNKGTLQLEGDEVLTALTNDTGEGTVKYDGAGNYTGLKAGNNYYNLTFNGTGTWVLNAALDTNEDLTITAGTLNANGKGITVGCNWSNTGTFTAGGGTVTLDTTDTATVSGSTNFNNLTIATAGKTVQFQNGQTQTVSGLLHLQGASGNRVSLFSNSQGSQWFINSTGTTDVSYVSVRDSNASGGNQIKATNNGTDMGNNINWKFAAGSPSENLGWWVIFNIDKVKTSMFHEIDKDVTDLLIWYLRYYRIMDRESFYLIDTSHMEKEDLYDFTISPYLL
jgi:hypothetical protein